MINRPVYLDQLKKFSGKSLVKVITGIRRAGKSTVLRLLRESLLQQGMKEEQVILLNFESLVHEELTEARRLYDFIRSQIKPGQEVVVLLDEIQEVKEWEKAVNALLADQDAEIFLTGSNSHLLSSELSTFLAGRYVEIPVFTLSYREFLSFRSQHFSSVDKPDQTFENYLRRGGFPVLHTLEFDEETSNKIVRDIYASVILRDTVQRYRIRDVDLLERVVRYVFDNIGNTFSGKKVADYFRSQQRKIDINTVYNYLYALEGAFILYKVPRYDIKGKEILKTQEKYYVSDLAFVHATMGYRDRMISGILENIVFLELKRRGYQVYVGKTVNLEIDFIGEKQGAKIYLQIAYKLESTQTIDREYSPLLAINDHYPKWVISMDDFFKDNIKGIQHWHITDFLLSDKW